MNRTRRDPRADRAARIVPGSGRPRFGIEVQTAAAPEVGPTGRPRRDPRGDWLASRLRLEPRPRYDRARRDGGHTAIGEGVAAAAAAPRLRIIDSPAFLVAALPETAKGRLTPHGRQLLGAARLLADAGGGAVLALVNGACEGLGEVGADRVIDYSVYLAGDYDPESTAAFVTALAGSLSLRHILFCESIDGGDLARRVAAEIGEPLFAGAESLSASAITRAAKGRRIEQRGKLPRMISLAPDAVAPHSGDRAEARDIAHKTDLSVSTSNRALADAVFVPADPATVSLADATFVVSAGNGVSDFSGFRQLAAALNGTPGASRVVCDAGLMPRAAQVGASGTVLSATCYFALGIAGAPQHLQGVADCEHVIAVNTDLHAAMIERAGLAIVADAQKVIPALLDLVAERTAP
ncbi:Electron transfer flavoprotein large subunit [Hartmannibacter diazotrophicus]|uniref:Electron transfer flavoprotein large subunit n=1 Tax=Hartmannibacter diazotrophicus TaxID=1482074 RepID=A0A2C9D082_9HYPH|nr:electron transfer flavoprotein subunit alpha/FixB family protein [Hartmannibacter diazotrophicus]SON53609.1 Electron transfer flavoprotein large subunit [Hartmannibacter diazotrophicus]